MRHRLASVMRIAVAAAFIITACKGQSCEGYFGLTWKDSGNGLQTQCDSAAEDGTCVYRCLNVQKMQLVQMV